MKAAIQREFTQEDNIGVSISTVEIGLAQDARSDQSKCGIAHINISKVLCQAPVGRRRVQMQAILVIQDHLGVLVDVTGLWISEDDIRTGVTDTHALF